MLLNLKALNIPEGSVIRIKTGNTILWEFITNDLPNEYIPLEWLRVSNGRTAYIDLGFTFDSKAKIYLTQFVTDRSVTAYPFGAAENSGIYRCMLSSPYSKDAYFYGSKGTEYTASKVDIEGSTDGCGVENSFEITIAPKVLHIRNLTNGKSPATTTTQVDYTMTSNLYLFAQNYNGGPRFGGDRIIGKFQYYDKNDKLICDLIPCARKSDGVLGMYDKARKLFLTNAGDATSGNVFKSGPVKFASNIKDWAKQSINEDGSIYNNGLGYKNNYRVRSGGTEQETAGTVCTGFIPLKKGETLRIYPPFNGQNSANTINFFDENFTNLGQITDNGSTCYGICSEKYATYKTQLIDGFSTITLDDRHDSTIAYVRVTNNILEGSGMIVSGSEMTITVNQEIA